MRVTKHFGIPRPVPFVNVHVERDNRVFLDPSAIRNSKTPHARSAQKLLRSYFDRVLACALSSDRREQRIGLRLLQQLHEPNETRLGMTARGIAGHAFGPELGERLWRELVTNRACQTAALRKLEHLPLFIKGVDKDLISDMATRIAYSALLDFTAEMMVRYPALAAHGVAQRSFQVWDSKKREWTEVPGELPVAPLHPLLLVPQGWVTTRLAMNAPAFYNRHATGTIQEERTRVLRGRELKPSKKVIRAEFRDRKPLNERQAAKYMTQGRDLVATYEAEVDTEFRPLTEEEIRARTD